MDSKTAPAPPTGLKADTIDGVIESLDRIIEWSKQHQKRTGYFAAVYRIVTAKVRKGIESGYFDDGPRMERLDIIFANRYLEAFEQHFTGQQTTEVWQIAFSYGEKWSPIVLQHLMVGMNAHINLDLGIAAAKTVPADELNDLKSDFMKINEVLGNLIDDVQNGLSEIWPLFKLIDILAGSLDERIAKCSMNFARDEAWQFATEYAAAQDKQLLVAEMDKRVAQMGKLFTHPGIVLRVLLLTVRLGELGDTTSKIEKLDQRVARIAIT